MEVRDAIQDRMTSAIDRRASELVPDLPAVLLGHVSVNGATNSSERSMMLGQDHVLLAGALGRPRVDYVALGHIHKHQVLRWDPPVIAYSGSLQRVDFSEEADERGFRVVDLDPGAPPDRRLVDFSFHPLSARPFVTVDATVFAGDEEPTEVVLRAVGRKDVNDAVVRVRINLPREAERRLREADIRQALRPAHYVTAISREITGENRWTRLDSGSERQLEPMQALRLYLESRDLEQQRLERILARAEELLAEEDPGLT